MGSGPAPRRLRRLPTARAAWFPPRGHRTRSRQRHLDRRLNGPRICIRPVGRFVFYALHPASNLRRRLRSCYGTASLELDDDGLARAALRLGIAIALRRHLELDVQLRPLLPTLSSSIIYPGDPETCRSATASFASRNQMRSAIPRQSVIGSGPRYQNGRGDTGTALSAREPSPSWPFVFWPQHRRAPDESTQA